MMEQPQQQSAVRHDQVADERECPICISVPRFAIKTNCGHLFCGKYALFRNK